MRCRRTTRVVVSWVATLAFLMAVLAPMVSHALGPAKDASWVEVCSATGSRWVQPDGPTDPAPSPGHEQAFEHCPCCLIHADAVAVSADPIVVAPAASAADRLPPAFLAAPRTLHAWVTAQPRAPPSFS